MKALSLAVASGGSHYMYVISSADIQACIVRGIREAVLWVKDIPTSPQWNGLIPPVVQL